MRRRSDICVRLVPGYQSGEYEEGSLRCVLPSRLFFWVSRSQSSLLWNRWANRTCTWTDTVRLYPAPRTCSSRLRDRPILYPPYFPRYQRDSRGPASQPPPKDVALPDRQAARWHSIYSDSPLLFFLFSYINLYTPVFCIQKITHHSSRLVQIFFPFRIACVPKFGHISAHA